MFTCPRCHHPLEALSCPGCGAIIPEVDGVPRFVGTEGYASGFGLQWCRHPRVHLDSHNGTASSRDRFF